ncbi:hypothetical protein N9322_00605 [bacterium]|jgi:hypothetical protein|nr:hypothetical protein [bacterium]|tara:strand:+ start:2561 stop:2809 length:249 start_codon:yes stop_codon:yes gene_type:complete
MGFNKRYINKERIVHSFSHRGILGVRELMGLEGFGKIEAIITTDDFSDKVVTAYQEGKENEVALDITDEILNSLKIKNKLNN